MRLTCRAMAFAARSRQSRGETAATLPANGRSIRHALPLGNRQDLVVLDVLQRLNGAAGPANLQTLRSCGVSHSEMNPHVVLRQITRTGFDVADKDLAGNRQLEKRADSVAIALGAHCSYEERVAGVSA